MEDIRGAAEYWLYLPLTWKILCKQYNNKIVYQMDQSPDLTCS